MTDQERDNLKSLIAAQEREIRRLRKKSKTCAKALEVATGQLTLIRDTEAHDGGDFLWAQGRAAFAIKLCEKITANGK